jgi:hypothetical protein
MGIAGFSFVIAILAFVIGALLLFAPSALKRLNELTARMVTKIDTLAFSYRIGIGISFLIVSAFMLFMAYYFTKRY